MENEKQQDESVATAVPDYTPLWCELRDPETEHYVQGWGVIVHGGEVSPEALTAALRDYLGEEANLLVSEVQHLHYTPRVKWCSRHDGGCDSEGDWHGHWFGVKHNPLSDCCYTLALPVFERTLPPGNKREGDAT